jgi:Rps23 Pro-64 3,4-dihydroxylase Tpa1-like proline 4-hydroxylase
MGNKDLNNNNIKLVKYTIVCIDRKHERVLRADERIVIDPMSHAAFASWMIADYLQSEYISDKKKYLQVSFDVLDSWSREAFTYKERQIEVLEQIRDKLRHI